MGVGTRGPRPSGEQESFLPECVSKFFSLWTVNKPTRGTVTRANSFLLIFAAFFPDFVLEHTNMKPSFQHQTPHPWGQLDQTTYLTSLTTQCNSHAHFYAVSGEVCGGDKLWTGGLYWSKTLVSLKLTFYILHTIKCILSTKSCRCLQTYRESKKVFTNIPVCENHMSTLLILGERSWREHYKTGKRFWRHVFLACLELLLLRRYTRAAVVPKHTVALRLCG